MSRRERGAAAVEFAIVLPVLFLVIAGIVDFGRAFYAQIELSNAAREGARTAVVLPLGSTPAPTTEVAARVSAALPGISDATVTPTYCPATSAASSKATVVVSRPFQWIVLGPAMRIVGGSLANGTISATGVMQCGG
ncbi:TadE/TadG family type IV pilus assembly protein [Intrasporangium sp. YIM S08009]|uniref:TadE/TadG family type IV pilus assembly protein n=1 Tax=Intrasporangium zincisolvens TaxID=3080018 RepID=UPI002B055BE2|nr:TadE/TadG family type IV pilus assembly protein [Intrasporangium sp. YIM S08009]